VPEPLSPHPAPRSFRSLAPASPRTRRGKNSERQLCKAPLKGGRQGWGSDAAVDADPLPRVTSLAKEGKTRDAPPSPATKSGGRDRKELPAHLSGGLCVAAARCSRERPAEKSGGRDSEKFPRTFRAAFMCRGHAARVKGRLKRARGLSSFSLARVWLRERSLGATFALCCKRRDARVRVRMGRGVVLAVGSVSVEKFLLICSIQPRHSMPAERCARRWLGQHGEIATHMPGSAIA
jgi:hypothetical protein